MTKVRFLLTLACALATVTAPLTVLAQDAQRYSRIIIKFRDDGAGKGRTQSVADAESRVRALNRGTLSYLKSVSPLTHVARTAQPLRHAELQVLSLIHISEPTRPY